MSESGALQKITRRVPPHPLASVPPTHDKYPSIVHGRLLGYHVEAVNQSRAARPDGAVNKVSKVAV